MRRLAVDSSSAEEADSCDFAEARGAVTRCRLAAGPLLVCLGRPLRQCAQQKISEQRGGTAPSPSAAPPDAQKGVRHNTGADTEGCY